MSGYEYEGYPTGDPRKAIASRDARIAELEAQKEAEAVFQEGLRSSDKARIAELEAGWTRAKDGGYGGYVGQLEARVTELEAELKLLRFAEPREYANAKRAEARVVELEAEVAAAEEGR